MTAPIPAANTAQVDPNGRLVAASEAIAGLQMRCGGTIPGAVAIPALAGLIAQAQAFGLKLARQILVHDGEEEIRAWAEVEPLAEPGSGWRIVLRHWQATALAPEDPTLATRLRIEIDRALAELTARLDARQRVLAADADAADLVALVEAMRGGQGRPWTDFVRIVGDSHHQPLHWRLLDGCRVAVPGSSREWRAGLVPVGAADRSPTGFELTLTADSPYLPAVPAPAIGDVADLIGERLIGKELAPVLRLPVARIIANAETIRLRLAGPLGDDYAQYAADIATAGAHLLELVDDLADLEVIESPDFTAASDPIDLADVARRACGILGVRAREKHIELAGPPPGATLPARAEFRRALQVLLNLVGNAIRYAPQASRVAIELEAAGAMARATVTDQGPGMSHEQQERIFEKFERLGRSGDGGSGLGLYISRRLARAMGGDLTVKSEPGQGARFTLEVPAGEVPAGEVPGGEATAR